MYYNGDSTLHAKNALFFSASAPSSIPFLANSINEIFPRSHFPLISRFYWLHFCNGFLGPSASPRPRPGYHPQSLDCCNSFLTRILLPLLASSYTSFSSSQNNPWIIKFCDSSHLKLPGGFWSCAAEAPCSLPWCSGPPPSLAHGVWASPASSLHLRKC